jgi:pimeloyl-[acyl-carrier protein] synthase
MIDRDTALGGAPLTLLQQDPYPLYDRLRAAGRVIWSDQQGWWMITGHAEALAVLKDSRMSVERTRAEGFDRGMERQPRRSMLVLDPPDHTRLRNLVQKAFTPRVIESLRGRIVSFVHDALDRAEQRGGLDLIEDLAYPLPVTVIAELLGVPSGDHEVFKAWSAAIAGSLDPVERDLAPVVAARQELRTYLAGIIAERRHHPQDDLITRLVEAEEQGDRLDAEELLQMCTLLLIAGHETTVNLIGNGVNALLDHPDQLARLRHDPTLLPTAIEELLRFDSPVQMTVRVVTEPIELGGQSLRPAQMTLVMLGAANHDPDAFPSPGTLDLSRTPNHHLSFGRGIHFCLGAPLARLEAQLAIGTLVRRFPHLDRSSAAQRRPTINLRGFSSLPISTAP